MGPVIAIVGAESTGKSTLAHALALELRALGRPAEVVGEYLREFFNAQGRVPLPHEQAAIAAEQRRRILAAAQGGGTVVADTTPLMIAVYSELLFGDRSLRAEALATQRRCACTLLTGLDLPWRHDGMRDGPHVRGPVDALIRGALGEAELAYAVIYGSGPARTAAALAAVRPVLGLAHTASPALDAASRLAARCDECVEPGGEQQGLAGKAAAR